MNEKCGNCHTPPLYTSNKLVAVEGFDPPSDGPSAADVLPVRIGVDARYALATHKGTGYYKVPSLKGVWYRGALGHHGSAASLEEWFDPARQSPIMCRADTKASTGRHDRSPDIPLVCIFPRRTEKT